MEAKTIHEAIHGLYAFANDEVAFGATARTIEGALGAEAVGFTWNDTGSCGSTLNWPHLAPPLAEAYVEEFHALDPWKVANLTAPVGVLQTSDQLVPRRDLVNSRFYEELLRRAHVEDFASIVLARSGAGSLVFGALYSARISPRKRRDLEALVPHVRRAMHLRQKNQELRLVSEALEAVAQPSGLALLLYEGNHERFRSRGASEALARCEERFRASLASQLRRDQAESTTIYDLGVTGSDAIALMYTERLGAFGPPWTRVLVSRGAPPERNGLHRILPALYGLSGAETRTCRALLRGLVPKEAAALLGVQPSTIRTQMISIFRKTGTSRQAELLVLLRRLGALPQKL